MRDIPIFTFINKLDREARNPYDLMEELEQEFGHRAPIPMNWPIGCGTEFKGVYDREKKEILAFNEFHRRSGTTGRGHRVRTSTTRKRSTPLIGEKLRQTLCDDIELLDGAGYEFDMEKVRDGRAQSRCSSARRSTTSAWSRSLESFLRHDHAAACRASRRGR